MSAGRSNFAASAKLPEPGQSTQSNSWPDDEPGDEFWGRNEAKHSAIEQGSTSAKTPAKKVKQVDSVMTNSSSASADTKSQANVSSDTASQSKTTITSGSQPKNKPLKKRPYSDIPPTRYAAEPVNFKDTDYLVEMNDEVIDPDERLDSVASLLSALNAKKDKKLRERLARDVSKAQSHLAELLALRRELEECTGKAVSQNSITNDEAQTHVNNLTLINVEDLGAEDLATELQRTTELSALVINECESHKARVNFARAMKQIRSGSAD